jgi:hypothetical protein
MQIDEVPGVVLHATPAIDPARPYGAKLTIATALEERRYYLSRQLLEDLARLIDHECLSAPLPERRGEDR